MPLLVALLGGSAVLALTLAVWLPATGREQAIRRRIAGFAGADLVPVDVGGQRRAPRLPTSADRMPRAGTLGRRIGDLLEAANVDATVGEIATSAALLGLALAAGALLTSSSVPLAVALGGAGAFAPLGWLMWRSSRQRTLFADQLADTTELLATMVRSGDSLLQAFEHVAADAPQPTRAALEVVVREIGLGSSQEDALERLALRYPSDDITLIVSSINVHQQIGGALSEVLDRMAETLRERARLAGEIRTLTAQQRYSAYVLAALPVAVGLLLGMLSPSYVAPFFQPGGLRLAALVAAGMVVLGFLILRRLAVVDDV